MFEDMIKSKQVMVDFKAMRMGSNNVEGVEFNVEILTSGHWPYQDIPQCNIPRQLNVCKSAFNNFYKQKFSNREINWLVCHGTVELKTTYLSRTYQIEATVYQTSIMCLFNENETLTFKEI